MIQHFVDRFMECKDQLRAEILADPPVEYLDLVRSVFRLVGGQWNGPDPEQVAWVRSDDYQGTLLFVTREKDGGSRFYYVLVEYGSCGGCDTLQAIQDDHYNKPPDDAALDKYMTLALHIVQGVKEIGD